MKRQRLKNLQSMEEKVLTRRFDYMKQRGFS
jgi:hypothetical protein